MYVEDGLGWGLGLAVLLTLVHREGDLAHRSKSPGRLAAGWIAANRLPWLAGRR